MNNKIYFFFIQLLHTIHLLLILNMIVVIASMYIYIYILQFKSFKYKENLDYHIIFIIYISWKVSILEHISSNFLYKLFISFFFFSPIDKVTK